MSGNLRDDTQTWMMALWKRYTFFFLMPSNITKLIRAWCESDVVLQPKLRLRITLARHKGNTQIVLDCKNAVISEIFAVLVEDLGGQVLVVIVPNDKVDVCRAVGVAVHHFQEMSSWTVIRDLV